MLGGRGRTGEITQSIQYCDSIEILDILEVLYKYAIKSKIDFALVTLDKTAYEGALSIREKIDPKISFHPNNLPDYVKEQAQLPIEHATEGNLATFIGSGCGY